MNPPRIQAEVFVLLKECLRGGMIGMAGHDEPVNRFPVTQACGAHFFGKDLKKRLLFHRRDRKGPLWTVVAEPRPLAGAAPPAVLASSQLFTLPPCSGRGS